MDREAKTLIVTICGRDKDQRKEPIPAVDRYLSSRIKKIYTLAEKAGLPFAILSGKFGLIYGRDPIPYYDKLLSEADIEAVAEKSLSFLTGNQIKRIIFFPPDPEKDHHVGPYIETMRRAAASAGADLDIRPVPPYPRRL